jgi:SAM-dependent methyltransferase
MNPDLIKLLACPDCGADLVIGDSTTRVAEAPIQTGSLRCSNCDLSYPVINGIPRFVPADNYANSFGFEWHRHATTQLDSRNGTTISHDRFELETGWTDDLKGLLMLEVGCGSGRFTEVALATGPRLVSIDYSSAVEVAAQNNLPNDRLDVVQADIYSLPFKKGIFDKIFCLGVMQHTPDVEEAFRSIVGMGRPGGEIVVDVYHKNRFTRLDPRLYLRPFTTRLPHGLLYKLVSLAVPVLLPIKSFIRRRTPLVGRYAAGLIPVANYIGAYPLSARQQKEWSILDTFDALSPKFDNPKTVDEVRTWFEESNMVDIEAGLPYVALVVGKGKVADLN